MFFGFPGFYSEPFVISSFRRVVEYLLRNDANPAIRDQQGYNAVHYAALNGHKLALEMVRYWGIYCITINKTLLHSLILYFIYLTWFWWGAAGCCYHDMAILSAYAR